MKIQNGNVAFPDTRKRDQRDIIIRKSVEVHDSVRVNSKPHYFFTNHSIIFIKPDNELSTDGLPKFSSTPSSTAPIETTTGFSVSSEMFYNLQEELRTVRNQHLTHGENYILFVILFLFLTLLHRFRHSPRRLEDRN